ncbi:hypothetical protein E7W45_00020 [Cronobacter sakazakii]|nr:hypothetical protein [Cronobacter sakazakii]
MVVTRLARWLPFPSCFLSSPEKVLFPLFVSSVPAAGISRLLRKLYSCSLYPALYHLILIFRMRKISAFVRAAPRHPASASRPRIKLRARSPLPELCRRAASLLKRLGHFSHAKNFADRDHGPGCD